MEMNSVNDTHPPPFRHQSLPQHSEVAMSSNSTKRKVSKIDDAQTLIAERFAKRSNNVIRQEVLSAPPTTTESPQDYLDRLFRQRGYSIERYGGLQGGYHCKPSTLQVASHGTEIVKAVRQSDVHTMKNMLDCGLSPNPCNSFGESIIHMICRRGDHKLLQLFLDNGASLQITDDFGRTPLHDACWTPEPFFELVELVLQNDRRLLNITDCRGSLPLAYVRKIHWNQWKEFLEKNKDIFWPERDVSKEGEESTPELVMKSPHTTPAPLPVTPASNDLVKAVARGKIPADVAITMTDDERFNYKEVTMAKPQVISSAQTCNQRNIQCLPNVVRYSCRGVVAIKPNQ